MTDLDAVLRDHLRRRVADVHPASRLDDVVGHGARPDRRRRSVALVAASLVVAGLGVVAVSGPDDAVAPRATVGPTMNDHWHLAYGLLLCGTWYELHGDGEASPSYGTTGVHSHDDGIIHWHPFTSESTGRRARLGLFFDTYGVDVTTERVMLPADQPAARDVDRAQQRCDGPVSVVVWPDVDDPSHAEVHTDDFRDIPITSDRMAIAIVRAPPGTPVPLPPSVDRLPRSG